LKIYTYIFLFLFLFSCKIRKNNNETFIPNNKVKVAFIKNNRNHFLLDTLKFKNNLSKEILDDKNICYDKIEICENFTIGEKIIKYYFLKMENFNEKIITVKYLIKYKDFYYFEEANTFELLYITCIGNKTNCPPNLYINNQNEYIWICSDDIKSCSTDNQNCNILKTVIFEN